MSVPVAVLLMLLGLASMAEGASFRVTAREELTHPGQGHELHLSSPAVAVRRDGRAVLAWAAPEGHDHHLFFASPGLGATPVRVNPTGLTVESLHQAPGLALGPADEVYLSWSSPKPIPPGGFFASDLRLSRSVDGGRTFEGHVRVNGDRPISHSFEGLAVASDGTVIVSWIDSRDGANTAGSYLARVLDRGSRVEPAVKLDAGETCVCCRIGVAAGARETIAVAWRKVLPGSIRDMVVTTSRDGGRSFSPAALVHADGWKIAACPHRGGSVALDGRGRVYLAWYTEGRDGQPRVLLAVSPDGRGFATPVRLDTAVGSIPDHVRLAADREGRVAVVWEEATAVRRRVVLRTSTDGGKTLSAPQVLSQAIKAYAPAVAVTPRGGFVLAWHEERFPSLTTVVQTLEPSP